MYTGEKQTLPCMNALVTYCSMRQSSQKHTHVLNTHTPKRGKTTPASIPQFPHARPLFQTLSPLPPLHFSFILSPPVSFTFYQD